MSEQVFTTYDKAVHWLGGSLVLCNNIPEIDESVYENFVGNYLDENENYVEIFQWFITNYSEDDVDWLVKNFDLIFTYSEKLDCYILCVDHYGTGWDYVACEVFGKDVQRVVKQDKLTYKDLTGYDR